MINRKRPRKTQEISFYETPSDCSEEEIQRSCEFLRKVKELDDKTIFVRFADAVKCYQSKSLSYKYLKTKVAYILRNHDVLLEQFHQLMSDLATKEATKEENRDAVKSDVERTVEFLNKLEATGKGLHGAFLNAFAFDGDIVALVENLDVVLRDHACLKEEFKAFLIDSRLLKKNRNAVLRRP
ncbi:hypothetical protein CARUB_v10015556mg [Capsella rubella]|uniref:Uncharacterized protein n=1 Tax=Capsella rubella TaxID=81985 RepID=R0HR80_9BRAS|nr:hypothetical protein CARUB_v10015556mg [Capsella rubella]